MKRKRKTVKQIRWEATDGAFSEACRVIKHKLGQELVADQLWQWYQTERKDKVFNSP
jgi:hypothetical protein